MEGHEVSRHNLGVLLATGRYYLEVFTEDSAAYGFMRGSAEDRIVNVYLEFES